MLRTKLLVASITMLFVQHSALAASELSESIAAQYQSYLEPLFKHFHANPELSLVENKTAERMAEELSKAGFEVTSGVGGTGVVAILKNGEGPLVSMRADMDGLPVLEKSVRPLKRLKSAPSPVKRYR